MISLLRNWLSDQLNSVLFFEGWMIPMAMQIRLLRWMDDGIEELKM